jgi:hypothetical protein
MLLSSVVNVMLLSSVVNDFVDSKSEFIIAFYFLLCLKLSQEMS